MKTNLEALVLEKDKRIESLEKELEWHKKQLETALRLLEQKLGVKWGDA